MVYARVAQSTSSTATSGADTHRLRKRETAGHSAARHVYMEFAFQPSLLLLLPACQLVDVKGPSPILGHPEASSEGENSAASIFLAWQLSASVAAGACLVHPRAARFQAFRDF